MSQCSFTKILINNPKKSESAVAQWNKLWAILIIREGTLLIHAIKNACTMNSIRVQASWLSSVLNKTGTAVSLRYGSVDSIHTKISLR